MNAKRRHRRRWRRRRILTRINQQLCALPLPEAGAMYWDETLQAFRYYDAVTDRWMTVSLFKAIADTDAG